MGSSNVGWVVGYLISPRKRWRLDFDPAPAKLVHVNEEDFDRPRHLQKVIHRVASRDKNIGPIMRNDTQVRLYWRKWTTRYGTPGGGILCPRCRVLHSSGRCPFP